MRRADLNGMRFGSLVARSLVGSKGGNALWLFKCDCGAEHIAQARHVKSGATKGCGCGRANNDWPHPPIHGDANRDAITKLYRVWQTMRQRCNNPRSKAYRWYGAIGISVCAEWGEFAKFREWATGAGYSEGLAIDRIDPSHGYEPGNCRWVTPAENSSRSRRWGTVTDPKVRKRRDEYRRDRRGKFTT